MPVVAAGGLDDADVRIRQERPLLLDLAVVAEAEVRDDEQRPLRGTCRRPVSGATSTPASPKPTMSARLLAGHVGQEPRVVVHPPALVEAEVGEDEHRV